MHPSVPMFFHREKLSISPLKYPERLPRLSHAAEWHGEQTDSRRSVVAPARKGGRGLKHEEEGQGGRETALPDYSDFYSTFPSCAVP